MVKEYLVVLLYRVDEMKKKQLFNCLTMILVEHFDNANLEVHVSNLQLITASTKLLLMHHHHLERLTTP